MAEDVVRAKRFELVDDEGEVRAILGPGPDNSVGLSFLGKGTAAERTSVGINAGGSAFVDTRDATGEGGIRLGVEEEGTAVIRFRDQQGRDRCNIGYRPAEAGDGPNTIGIRFADENGRGQAQLGVAPNGDANLILYDQAGNEKVSLVVEAGGGRPTITLNDGQSIPRVGISLYEDGTPILGFLDERGSPVWRQEG